MKIYKYTPKRMRLTRNNFIVACKDMKTKLLYIILFLFINFIAISKENVKIPTHCPNFNIWKIAHRGINKFAPENTIPAIEKAIEMGFDWVELDVHFSSDNYPVIIHDITLDRTTPMKGSIKNFTLEELIKIDAGSWFDEKFRGVKIPSLEEALKIMKGKIKLYLDIKEPLPNKFIIELLKKYDFYPNNLVIEGGTLYQRIFRLYDKNAPVMPYLNKIEEIPIVLKKFPRPKAFNMNYKNVTKEIVESAHKRGIYVFVNTLGTDGLKTENIKYVIDVGADAIQTDHPDVLLKFLKNEKSLK